MDDDVYFLTNGVFLVGAASDDGGTGFVYAVEIVFQCGDVDHSECIGLSELYEHSMIANFGYYGLETRLLWFL